MSLPESLRSKARVDGEAVEMVTKEPTPTLHELTSWAVQNRVDLDGLTVTRPSLEDVYLEITREAS
jgi:ABC-2 type transport system ATP-binding protein